MSPSSEFLNRDQIDKVYDMIVAGLEKAALPSAVAEQVLKMQGEQFVADIVEQFRTRLEASRKIVVRRVQVDRTKSPEEVLADIVSSGRSPHVNKDLLRRLPQGMGDEVDVCFVPLKHSIPAGKVSEFLAYYGLVADPRAQAAVNVKDPGFADTYPNAVEFGGNVSLTFARLNERRYVSCDVRPYKSWTNLWFLSGVRPSSK